MFKLNFFPLRKPCRATLKKKKNSISREYFPSGASWGEYALNSIKTAERQHDLLRKQFMKSISFKKPAKDFTMTFPYIAEFIIAH